MCSKCTNIKILFVNAILMFVTLTINSYVNRELKNYRKIRSIN